jgi:hypothetical protein
MFSSQKKKNLGMFRDQQNHGASAGENEPKKITLEAEFLS